MQGEGLVVLGHIQWHGHYGMLPQNWRGPHCFGLNCVSHRCTILSVRKDPPQVGELVHMESFGLSFANHPCTILGAVLEDHPQVGELVHMEYRFFAKHDPLGGFGCRFPASLDHGKARDAEHASLFLLSGANLAQ